MNMKTAGFFFVCLLSVLADTCAKQSAKVETWEFLLLAQFWPATSCVYFKETGCVVPPEVKGWTIHGLWPSRNGTQQPENCNSSLVFNPEEIKDLLPRLNEQWPYYNKTGEKYELWKHEWDKHGTCAYQLPSLRGELKYFNETLLLHKPLNTYQALAESKIYPAEDAKHLPKEMFEAVRKYYGTIPNIACYYDKESKQHYFDQVWLCFDKEFKLQDCAAAQLSRNSAKNLQFESEKSTSLKSQAHKNPNYYVDCDQSKELIYGPIPHTMYKGL